MTIWIDTNKLGWEGLLDYSSRNGNGADQVALGGNSNHEIDVGSHRDGEDGQKNGTSAGSGVLVNYGESLQLSLNEDGSYSWKCASCGNYYCDHADTPKMHSNVLVLPLNSIHPWGSTVRLDDQRFFCRIYLCPSCGRSFASEVSRPDDPVIPDALLDTGWLADAVSGAV
jgi:ribosomal protein L37AE/L43A